MTDARHDTDPDGPLTDPAPRREKDTLDIILDGFRGKRPAPAVESAQSKGRDSAFFEGEARPVPEPYAAPHEDPVLIRERSEAGPTFIIPKRRRARGWALLALALVGGVLVWRLASSGASSEARPSATAMVTNAVTRPTGGVEPAAPVASSPPTVIPSAAPSTTPSTFPSLSATVSPRPSPQVSSPSTPTPSHVTTPRPPVSSNLPTVAAPPESDLLK